MAGLTSTIVGGLSVANSIYQGNKNRQATDQAARTQADAAQSAADQAHEAQQQFREDLSPFREAGVPAIGQLSELAMNPEARLAAIQEDPLFQASLASRDRATLGAAANQGRIGTGDFSQQLSENFLLSASPLLSAQEQRLTNLAQIGQSSAAQTGTSGLQAASIAGQAGMAGADALSAGTIAANEARARRNAEVLGGAGSLIGALANG